MLFIDDDMLKLAKMQERLLSATDSNKENNLENYKKTVIQIDSEAFASLLEEIKHLDEHNQSLEKELQFLKTIKGEYEQLNELQLGFINVCELYGSGDIKLSDLSQLNIDYINERINVIEGYLLNLKNIEINKQEIQEFSEQLVEQEKKKDYLNSKLEQLEIDLKDSFFAAEGRKVIDGSLGYTSVVNEYKDLGIDLATTVDNFELLKGMLFDKNKEKNEFEEKFRTAEICYNNFPNAESKQILDEIRMDFLKVKYNYSMIRIVEELSNICVNYDLFKEKREKILDLIKYRLSCLESLGVRFSIDPFSRTKTREQLDSLMSFTDNSKIINRIRKEIGQLTDRTEKMISQNNDYLISLAETKELLISKVGINNIDISSVKLPQEDASLEIKIEKHEENQVVGVREPANLLNMSIIRQKTIGVIKRVIQMINDNSLSVSTEIKEVVNTSPELVIVPAEKHSVDNTLIGELNVGYDNVFVDDIPKEETDLTLDNNVNSVLPEPFVEKEENNIFETLVPFEEPVMFREKYDDSLEKDKKVVFQYEDVPFLEELPFQQDVVDEMPDAFWVTESANKEVINDEEIVSFDEQIESLLSEQSDVKTRKLEVDKNIRKAA